MAHRKLSIVLILTQLSPAWGANLPLDIHLKPLGIQRVGSLGPTNESAYLMLEKRVQRWVENMEQVRVEVKKMTLPMEAHGLVLEEANLNLIRNTDRLSRQLIKGKSSTAEGQTLVNEMRLDRQKLSGVSQFGPSLQRSLVTEGAYLWKLGRSREMKEVLRRAVRMHPKGLVEAFSEWDSHFPTSFDGNAFEAVLSAVHIEQPRNCKVQIQTSPTSVKLSVNGFDVGSERQLSLSGNALHHLRFSAPGYAPKEELLRCERLGGRRLEVGLEKWDRLDPHSRKSKGHSVILIQPLKDQFKLFLYTPDRAMDEFPLRKPIRVAELLLEGGEADIPVATDAALSLFQKHQLAFNQEIPRFNSGDRATWASGNGSTELEQNRSRAWYTSPVFWGIVGGVVAGGAITYFATRPGGPEANELGEGSFIRK